MERRTAFLLTLFLLPALAARADDQGKGRDGRGNDHNDVPKARPGQSFTRPAAEARKPVVIDMSHGSSGGHNRNFPSQQAAQPAAGQPDSRPSYGRLNGWNQASQNRVRTQPSPWTPQNRNGGRTQAFQRPDVQAYTRPDVRAAVVVHHHPYTPGYVRGKLKKIGVTAEPSLITNRAEVIHTDRLHSVIAIPRTGPDHGAWHGAVVSPRHFNDPVVRRQMGRIDNATWLERIHGFHSTEREANHYYWHRDNGFDYCHYIDPSGYHWWGWSVGGQFFWTRHFHSRWWWYDSDYDRWCFWNNGFWWWQDPYHVGDLYCYNNATYIPSNSANDQVVVTVPVNPDTRVTNSPDGTRVVKVVGESQDAFLYDTANPRTFDPVYLASGVQSVQFSDTSNGRPLEIMLRLNDGSFDMFDSYGNAYNPGAFDSDQAAQDGNDNNAPPPDAGNPPDNDAPVN